MTEHLAPCSKLASERWATGDVIPSPWQNGLVERLIGSARRECTDHVIVFNDDHLRRILSKYARYYNEVRTHLSLGKDAPAHARSSGSEALSRNRSLVGYTIDIARTEFSEAAGGISQIGPRDFTAPRAATLQQRRRAA
jgi:hypothetical protein